MSRPICPECGARNARSATTCRKCGAGQVRSLTMSKPVKLTLIAILLAYAGYFGVQAFLWAFK